MTEETGGAATDAAASVGAGAAERLQALGDSVWNGETSPETAALRLGAALLLTGALGFEREARGRAAGLRTHMMVGLASALFTLLSFELYAWVQEAGGRSSADPLRLLEAITAGVAFLAAGSIFRGGGSGGVKGLTTGAGLWMAGAIGMACGIGALGLAALASAMALAVLLVLRWLEP